MELKLRLATRYHESQKQKGSNKEKTPQVTGSNSIKPPQGSSFKTPHQKDKEGNKFEVSKDKPHAALLNKDNDLISYEKERSIEEGLLTYCGVNNPIGKCFKRPQKKPGPSRGFPSKLGKALVGLMMCSMVLTYYLKEHNCAL
ncbi:hypothetical protein O181_037404 [Austropuccinia psidii MF-1]|uniref:Uncharacterized protein n=1 Tax=Austropuccinia psidii MF-1 TaxID=1389203 RepID=A0A9Q3D6C3_9BASI|nr:hypothetical protein [Austropuccinia psidii MF-1]